MKFWNRFVTSPLLGFLLLMTNISLFPDEASSRELWPQATIPYIIEEGFSSDMKETITNSMEHIQDVTPIRFIKYSGQRDYLRLKRRDNGTCTAGAIGKLGGEQVMQLRDNCGWLVTHELAHVIGLFHEHARHDRDTYTRGATEAKHPATMFFGPFDVSSVTLYGWKGSGIKRSDGGDFLGMPQKLSQTDRYEIHKLYGGQESRDVYGRGVGFIPPTCPSGYYHAGVECWKNCPSNYADVAGVCWQRCKGGYTNDGAFCRRNAVRKNASGKCPWYDVCGLTLAKGCKSCPKGWRRDGCGCWKDVHIYAKDSFITPRHGKGCPQGFVKNGQLCYPNCGPGYRNNGGPLCHPVL